jgi:hypothetical protein
VWGAFTKLTSRFTLDGVAWPQVSQMQMRFAPASIAVV